MRKIIAGMFITLDGVYLGPEGDGHPVALADITQCDNSSITSISDRCSYVCQGDRMTFRKA